MIPTGPSGSAGRRSEAPTGWRAGRRALRRCSSTWPTSWSSPRSRRRWAANIRYFVSGSAALNGDIAGWFDSAGLTILEGYGLTETSAAACIVRPENIAFGTVGQPLPGTEIRIADDGEILIKGPGVMRGYRNRPEDNAEAFAPGGGWFASGDIGIIDDKGRVKITDRKKDLVKTSGGKYIAPGAIESAFKASRRWPAPSS